MPTDTPWLLAPICLVVGIFLALVGNAIFGRRRS